MRAQARRRLLFRFLQDVDMDTALMGSHQRHGADLVLLRHPRRALRELGFHKEGERGDMESLKCCVLSEYSHSWCSTNAVL